MTSDMGVVSLMPLNLEPCWFNFSKDSSSLGGDERTYHLIAWALKALQLNFLPFFFSSPFFLSLPSKVPDASQIRSCPWICAGNSVPPCAHTLIPALRFQLCSPVTIHPSAFQHQISLNISYCLLYCALCPCEFMPFLFLCCHLEGFQETEEINSRI